VTSSSAARSLYDSPDAARRLGQEDVIAKVQAKHQAEAKTHRDALSSALAKLTAKHQKETKGFGSYRLPDRVLKSQKIERAAVRSDHEILSEKIEQRQRREMAEALRKAERSTRG
jgi:hypothetical protein